MSNIRPARWHLTGKKLEISVNRTNRRILASLKVEGASTVDELAKSVGKRPQTIAVELHYLEKLGVVKEAEVKRHEKD